MLVQHAIFVDDSGLNLMLWISRRGDMGGTFRRRWARRRGQKVRRSGKGLPDGSRSIEERAAFGRAHFGYAERPVGPLRVGGPLQRGGAIGQACTRIA